MAYIIHRQMHQSTIGCFLRPRTQTILNGNGAWRSRWAFHCSSVATSDFRQPRLSRTRAQEHSEQGASAVPVPANAPASSKGTAGATDGDPITVNGVPSNISAARDISKNSSNSSPRPSVSSKDAEEKAGSKRNSSGNNDGNGLSSLEVASATFFIEKIAGALVMYGLAILLSNLSGMDSTRELLWNDGAPLAVGAIAAVPIMLVVGLLFLPSLDLGFKLSELRTVSEAEAEEDATLVLSGNMSASFLGLDNRPQGEEPPITAEAIKQGLWLYQMHVLKPWYPSFRWSEVGVLYMASCAASGAQELLVRGYGGAVLKGWYGNLLASTTDVNNPIYWAKVFKLVTPDTARWLAAFSLIILQVALSSSMATRASAFARTALNRLGRVPSEPLVKGVVVQNVRVTLGIGADAEPKVESQDQVTLEVPTPEERVVYWASLAVSILLVGATNCAWAASGSLLGSYTAQVAIDGVMTGLQQFKSTRLPENELWMELQQEQEEQESDDE